jgi:DNA polymerase-3 subunit epsilon
MKRFFNYPANCLKVPDKSNTGADFAAIDFETANRQRSSVCSVGVVIVRNGQISENIYRLIRPTPNYYSRFCTEIHGMRYCDTANAADFPSVWAEIAPKIAGLPLVAHNSPFDEGCLRAVHKACSMNYPDYTFYCTCQASRRMFGKQLPNHRLHTVAAHCGYDLQNHHHALADAEACAWIAQKIIFINKI